MKNKKLEEFEFLQRIQDLVDRKEIIFSKQGKRYSSLQITSENIITGRRDNAKHPEKFFTVDLRQLYLGYCKLTTITPSTLRKYARLNQSPAWAILNAINLL